MKIRAGDTIRTKGSKVRYFITKVQGDTVYFDAPGGISGSFNIQFFKIRRV